MTPIKKIVWFDNQIYIIDHADIATLSCIAANAQQRDWLISSLTAYHKVEAHETVSLPILRYLVPSD
jgi:hypothetical protein